MRECLSVRSLLLHSTYERKGLTGLVLLGMILLCVRNGNQALTLSKKPNRQRWASCFIRS
jgi:hypothetical protein